MGPAENADDHRGPGASPGQQVARGVPDDGHFGHVVDSQPQHGGEDHVGPRPPASRVRRGQHEVNQPLPSQRGDDAVAGGRGEAGGQAESHPRVPEGGQAGLGPGDGPHLAPVDGAVEGVLEGRIGLLGPVPVAIEQLGEHGDLGLAHGAADVLLRVPPEPTCGQADRVERVLEGFLDGAVVGHRGAGHVQGHQSDRGFHAVTSSQVCSAIAGDRVIPRPAGPVTTHTAGSMQRR